jgi:hypothetical protein
MNALTAKLQASPFLSRVLPFFVFLLLTSCQGSFGPESHFWVYLTKCIVGAWMIWATWPLVSEMRWTISFEALLAGTLVFILWVAMDVPYPKFSQPDESWNLYKHFGPASMMVWLFAGVRIAGSTLLVPMLEEVFYRSFLYRYILAPNWMFIEYNSFAVKPFLITSIVFGITHQHWLAGIICGMIYQFLVIRTNRVGDAITAHAVTNLLLGAWVITQGFGYAKEPQWHLW